MKAFRLLIIACVLLAGIVGCGPTSDSGEPSVITLPVPSATGSSRPALAEGPSGGLLMSWVEPLDSSRTRIAYASFDGREWSRPSTFVEGDDLFTNWADVQRLHETEDGWIVGTWGVQSGASYLMTDLMIGRMDPSGTRSGGRVVHRDGTATQHGFVSLVETDDGSMLVWLDGRETMLEEGVTDESEWGNMTLRAGLLDSEGGVDDSWLLDARVCDCCPTSLAATDTGALVAYRNRGDDERRDIHLVRYDNGAFTDPYPLHEDGWVLRGCPVNGPALDSDGDRVVVAWFTAANDIPVVKAAFSTDGGRTFSEPVTVDADRPHGRVGTVLQPDGSAAVSWIGTDERMRAIKLARVSEAGVESTTTIDRPQSPAFTGIPAIGRIDDSIVVVWTDGPHPDSTRIQARRLDL